MAIEIKRKCLKAVNRLNRTLENTNEILFESHLWIKISISTMNRSKAKQNKIAIRLEKESYAKMTLYKGTKLKFA